MYLRAKPVLQQRDYFSCQGSELNSQKEIFTLERLRHGTGVLPSLNSVRNFYFIAFYLVLWCFTESSSFSYMFYPSVFAHVFYYRFVYETCMTWQP